LAIHRWVSVLGDEAPPSTGHAPVKVLNLFRRPLKSAEIRLVRRSSAAIQACFGDVGNLCSG